VCRGSMLHETSVNQSQALPNLPAKLNCKDTP
jgi:hypothetical protein